MSILFQLRPRRGTRPRPAGRLLGAFRAGAFAAMVCSLSAVPGALANAGPTILVLGDSISAGYGIQRELGWVEHLRERLSDHPEAWQVVNASVSGETTGGGLARLPDALEAHRPDLVILELGGNDGLRGYPVATIRDNLDRMVRLVQDAGGVPLVVGMQIPPNYGPRYTRAFAGVFPEVAERYDVPLVPFLLERVALSPELMQSDGIHPTAEAQPLLLETIWPHLAPLLERLAASPSDPGQAAATSG